MKLHTSAGPAPAIPILTGSRLAECNPGLDVDAAIARYRDTGDLSGVNVPADALMVTLAVLSPFEKLHARHLADSSATQGASMALARVQVWESAAADAHDAAVLRLAQVREEGRDRLSDAEAEEIVQHVPEPPTDAERSLATEYLMELTMGLAQMGVRSMSCAPGTKPTRSGRWLIYPREGLDSAAIISGRDQAADVAPDDVLAVVGEIAAHVGRMSSVAHEGKAFSASRCGAPANPASHGAATPAPQPPAPPAETAADPSGPRC